jgi:hypothetical protein
MAELQEKVKKALDESRMLILASQVMIGFQFQAVFQPGFETLSLHSQNAHVAAFVLMLVAFIFLTTPASRHRVVEKGHSTEAFHRFTSAFMAIAPWPFLASFVLSLAVAVSKVYGKKMGFIAAVLLFMAATYLWYLMKHTTNKKVSTTSPKHENPTDLSQRITQVLTEARMILPGVQALLGFQFSIILMEAFNDLNASAKTAHFSALGFLMLSIILLMTPPIHHRVVEKGEDTESFHSFTSRIILFAMSSLAIGMSLDFYVLVSKIHGPGHLGVISSFALALIFPIFWLGSCLPHKLRLRKLGRVEFLRKINLF